MAGVYCLEVGLFIKSISRIDGLKSISRDTTKEGGGVTVIGQLSQWIHVGRPREITKFAVDKLRSATPIRLSLSSTVEAVATLVIKYLFRKLFSCNRVKKLPLEVAPRTTIALMVGLNES